MRPADRLLLVFPAKKLSLTNGRSAAALNTYSFFNKKYPAPQQ